MILATLMLGIKANLYETSTVNLQYTEIASVVTRQQGGDSGESSPGQNYHCSRGVGVYRSDTFTS